MYNERVAGGGYKEIQVETKTIIHAFEEKGLGIAPFSYSHEIDMGSVKAGGICEFCGQAIRFCEVIRSADGRTFIVGNECVKRTGDKGLIDTVKREARRQRAEAKYQKMAEEAEARLEAQRARNGGLTDWELSEKTRQEAEAKESERIAKANAWILRALSGSYGSWAENMKYTLENMDAVKFSVRNKTIFAELHAKQFGKRGTKAYEEAYAEAAAKLEI